MKYLKHTICTLLSFFALNFLLAQTADSIPEADTTFSYNSIHYRASAMIEIDGQVFGGQLNFVNIIDSFLYMQLNIAGLEAGRILLTPDNILFINKFQKNYYDGNYTFLEQLIDVDINFYQIQAIFNGSQVNIPEELLLFYEEAEDSFFNILICAHEYYPIKLILEIKKTTFNNVPKVSANVPKNFKAIEFLEEY